MNVEQQEALATITNQQWKSLTDLVGGLIASIRGLEQRVAQLESTTNTQTTASTVSSVPTTRSGFQVNERGQKMMWAIKRRPGSRLTAGGVASIVGDTFAPATAKSLRTLAANGYIVENDDKTYDLSAKGHTYLDQLSQD